MQIVAPSRLDAPSRLEFPAGDIAVCDCHVHVFTPETHPYAANRRYTPPSADTRALQAHMQALGARRCVLVQPSCYATDNSALCAAMQQMNAHTPEGAAAHGATTRGVAVVDVHADHQRLLPELLALHACGVRGLRLNLHVQDLAAESVENAMHTCAQTARLLHALHRQMNKKDSTAQWHIQLHAAADLLHALAPALSDLDMDVVLDHFGGGAAAQHTVQGLLQTGRVWVKLSAPYRASRDPHWADLREPVLRYAAIAPQRLLWASDWPHTGGDGPRTGRCATDIEPFRCENPAQWLAQLAQWLDARVLQQLLQDNPQRLYGF